MRIAPSYSSSFIVSYILVVDRKLPFLTSFESSTQHLTYIHWLSFLFDIDRIENVWVSSTGPDPCRRKREGSTHSTLMMMILVYYMGKSWNNSTHPFLIINVMERFKIERRRRKNNIDVPLLRPLFLLLLWRTQLVVLRTRNENGQLDRNSVKKIEKKIEPN